LSKIEKQLQHPVPLSEQKTYNSQPAHYWNNFYTKNENRFFKDRHWLKLEFPECFENRKKLRVCEIGCGAGNAFFPLLNFHKEQKTLDFHVFGFDYSDKAIQVVKENEQYDKEKCTAFVYGKVVYFKEKISLS
jgi:tRNAThr (cytosine32-N3)-methyltransferase